MTRYEIINHRRVRVLEHAGETGNVALTSRTFGISRKTFYGLATQTVAAGEVEVTITPTRLDTIGAEFDIAFDTHSVDLDLNITQHATLTVDDQPWTNPTWDGAGPGGHHREGTLTFTSTGPVTGDAALTIAGLDEPVTARWALSQGT